MNNRNWGSRFLLVCELKSKYFMRFGLKVNNLVNLQKISPYIPFFNISSVQSVLRKTKVKNTVFDIQLIIWQ